MAGDEAHSKLFKLTLVGDGGIGEVSAARR